MGGRSGQSVNKTIPEESLGFYYKDVRSYFGSQLEDKLISEGWKYMRDVYPIVSKKDYWLGTDGTFERSSEEEFKNIDSPIYKSDSRSRYKIKDGILYRGSDHWGKVASCNWYAPFEIKPWLQGGWFYFKIPLSKLKRNKNIIIEKW